MVQRIVINKRIIEETNSEFYCDFCNKELHIVHKCQICGKDICREHMHEYMDYIYCVNCFEIGEKFITKMNNLYDHKVQADVDFNKCKQINMKLWKDAILE